jgi:hypothetical protein
VRRIPKVKDWHRKIHYMYEMTISSRKVPGIVSFTLRLLQMAQDDYSRSTKMKAGTALQRLQTYVALSSH